MDSTLKKISEPSMENAPTRMTNSEALRTSPINCPGIDNVNHPNHYTDGKIEPIDFIEDKNLNFNLGNVIKYISRSGKKKSKGMSADAKALEDLKKARFYLEREIAKREKEIK